MKGTLRGADLGFWRIEEVVRLGMGAEQGVHAPAQFLIARAGQGEIGRAFIGAADLQRGGENGPGVAVLLSLSARTTAWVGRHRQHHDAP